MYLSEINNCCIANIKKVTTSDLHNILEILILYNKNIYCLTNIIFELCCREFQLIIDSKNYILENTNLRKLKKYIQQLSLESRFSKEKFRILCHELILKDQITLEIVWWLNQSNLIYIEEYWASKSTSHIILQLKTLVTSYENNFATLQEQEEQQYHAMIRDVFVKLLLGVNLQTSTVWSLRNQNIFEEYLDDALTELIFQPNNTKLFGFIKVFSEMNVFYGSLIKEMCKNIIDRLITTYEEKLTIYEAIEKQEQWTTSHLGPNTLSLYFELLKRYTLEELFEIIQDVAVEKINWRLVLTMIAVFVCKIQDGYKQLKNITGRQLQNILTEPLSTTTDEFQVLQGLVYIRQACLEQPEAESEYSTWFCSTLGADSRGVGPSAWALLLRALRAALSHEPAWVLRVHVARALRAPPLRHHDMLAYKQQCRDRLDGVVTTAEDSDDFC